MTLPSSDFQKEFETLCRSLLQRDGTDLFPSLEQYYARLVGVVTPTGKVFIKETLGGLHVSTPNYDLSENRRINSIYRWNRDTDRVLTWDADAARKVMPYLERRLVLDLLADL